MIGLQEKVCVRGRQAGKGGGGGGIGGDEPTPMVGLKLEHCTPGTQLGVTLQIPGSL